MGLLTGLIVMQSLDVSRWSNMTPEGLQAIAAVTQLTSLNASSLVMPHQATPDYLFSGGLGPLSSLTGAALIRISTWEVSSKNLHAFLTTEI